MNTHSFSVLDPAEGRHGSHRPISHDVSSQTRPSECWEILDKNPFQLPQRTSESQLIQKILCDTVVWTVFCGPDMIIEPSEKSWSLYLIPEKNSHISTHTHTQFCKWYQVFVKSVDCPLEVLPHGAQWAGWWLHFIQFNYDSTPLAQRRRMFSPNVTLVCNSFSDNHCSHRKSI